MLQAFRPNRATNPYLLQLVNSLEPLADVETFSWTRAITHRFDVIHFHWPEVLVRGRRWWEPGAKSVLFLTVLVIARTRRTAIVRTVHNAEPHESIGPVRQRLLALCDRWTTEWITMTPTLPVPQPSTLILHGHYRDWYTVPEPCKSVSGRVLFFGHIRRYKGLDALLSAFIDLADEGSTLRVVGRPLDAEVVDMVEATAVSDSRISARLEFVPDGELALEIASAQLVVLPYRSMVNSGALLLALSLGRPVLVPGTASADEIRAEVGEEWVTTYAGPLTSEVLAAALAGAAEIVDERGPDLSLRDWPQVASAHVAAYLRARALASR